MKELFAGYNDNYVSETMLAQSKVVVCFDANILLNLYRYEAEVREQVISLIKIVKNSGRTINRLDINSTSIEVRHSTYDDSGIIYCGIRNYLEILINYQNQLMVEGKWDQTLDSIPVSIIDWYLDKNQSWGLDKISSKICQHEISMLTNIFNNQGGSEQILEQINYWNKRLEITRLIGSYETTPRYYSILIQGDNRTKIINYFRILDKINQGVLELRNSLNLEKFDIEYANLNLNLNKELKMKEAIDEVYPVLINPLVFYPRIPPPPPPNPPKGYKVNECYW